MSEGKIKCIIKRPDEQYGHVTNISTSLKNLQRIVDGRIETVSLGNNAVVVCNAEGKLRRLQKNFWMGLPPYMDVICGEAIVIGVDGEDLCDLPISFDTWKRLLQSWGNR